MTMALGDRGLERDDALPELRYLGDPQRERRAAVARGYRFLAKVAVVTAAALTAAALRRFK